VRETAEIEMGRPMIVTLMPGGKFLTIKLKCQRTKYTVTYRQMWIQGAHNMASDLKRKKAEDRELRKALR
jgi:hypothetical protein